MHIFPSAGASPFVAANKFIANARGRLTRPKMERERHRGREAVNPCRGSSETCIASSRLPRGLEAWGAPRPRVSVRRWKERGGGWRVSEDGVAAGQSEASLRWQTGELPIIRESNFPLRLYDLERLPGSLTTPILFYDLDSDRIARFSRL